MQRGVTAGVVTVMYYFNFHCPCLTANCPPLPGSPPGDTSRRLVLAFSSIRGDKTIDFR